MWRCPKCHANLLDNTQECPVCQLSPDQAAVVRPASPEPSSKFWFRVLVGVLIPPLGLVMLLTYLLTPPDKDPL